MSLDARARQAGEAVRASTRTVSPIPQLVALKRESQLRRRSRSALAAATAVVVVVTSAWLLTGQLGKRATSIDPATPRPTTSSAAAAPVTVGSSLGAGVTARVPRDWFVICDCSYVELTAAGPPVITMVRLTQVLDPATGRPVAAPADYAGWLRSHPWLTVVAQRTVRVAGQDAPQVTVRVRDGAFSTDPENPQLRFVKVAGPEIVQPYSVHAPGDLVTDTVLTVHGQRVLVSAFGGTTTTPEDERTVQQALRELLASIRT